MIKTTSVLIYLLVLVVFSFQFSCKSDKENSTSSEIETKIDLRDIAYEDYKTSEILEDYLLLKESLVASNVSASKSAATKLSENFPDDPRNALKSFSVQIEKSDDLEEQRKLFFELSTHIQKVLSFRMTQGELYKQHCPMAFNNNGAFWFSLSEDIRNPYFGDKMLKCGKVVDTIQKRL